MGTRLRAARRRGLPLLLHLVAGGGAVRYEQVASPSRMDDHESVSEGSGPGVHRAATTGYSRGSDAYSRGRPSYPAETVDFIAGSVRRSSTVLDVGAGTGAMATLLAGRGLRVVSAEPVAAMAAKIDRHLRPVRGEASRLPVRACGVGAVVAATAFHWFASPETIAEFDRVLEPQGVVALVWNVRDETVPWVRDHSSLVDRHAGDAPRYASMSWRDPIASSTVFVVADEHRVSNPAPMTRDRLVERILSTSFIAALPDDERDSVALEAADLAATLPDSFDYPYVSHTVLLTHR